MLNPEGLVELLFTSPLSPEPTNCLPTMPYTLQIQRKKVNPPLLNFPAETMPLPVSWIPEIAGN